MLNYVVVVNLGFRYLSAMVRRKNPNMWMCIGWANILMDLLSRFYSFANTSFPGNELQPPSTTNSRFKLLSRRH